MSEGVQSDAISVNPYEDYFCQLYLFLWDIAL